MDHLLTVESLLYSKGAKGVSINDIVKVINNSDHNYILYLLARIEIRLESTVLSLKYNPDTKHFYLMIRPEFIDFLQEMEIVKPRLSKAATATLAVIIFYHYRKQKIDIEFLKSLRSQNVKSHLLELQDANYIKFNPDDGTYELTQKLISEIDLPHVVKELEKYF